MRTFKSGIAIARGSPTTSATLVTTAAAKKAMRTVSAKKTAIG